jgi:colanic acid/amylovoran biosynthesis protein
MYLKYPSKIFLREESGIKSAIEYTKRNLYKKDDIVLSGKELDLSNIYKTKSHEEVPKILHNSICVIPNNNLFLQSRNEKNIYSLYILLLNTLLENGKNIYILAYSDRDRGMIEQIKSEFSKNDKVVFLDKEFDAITLEALIGKFDFIVSSRYHSIIHAYKNCIPSLVLGWALKYESLAKKFKQDEYFFDISEGIHIDKIQDKLRKLLDNFNHEKKVIAKEKSHDEKDAFGIMFNELEK